jgi:hypothetical protein
MKHLKLSLAVCAVALARSPVARAHGKPDIHVTRRRMRTSPVRHFRLSGADRHRPRRLLDARHQLLQIAVRDQMEQRGYHYVDENPDLLVNFYAKVHERTEVRRIRRTRQRMATTAIATACTARGRSTTTTSAP